MIIGHHLIFTAYGWWLPNDPRGSTSHEIRVEHIEPLGERHDERKRVQPLPRELREFYEYAERVLKHDLLKFSEAERQNIAEAFAGTIRQRGYTCYAAAIMPDHVHLLVRKHRDTAETMMESLQESSRHRLRVRDFRSAVHPVWGGPGWKVFQFTPEDMVRTVRYIEQNPVKAQMAPQKWGFVVPYEGWKPGLRQGIWGALNRETASGDRGPVGRLEIECAGKFRALPGAPLIAGGFAIFQSRRKVPLFLLRHVDQFFLRQFPKLDILQPCHRGEARDPQRFGQNHGRVQ